METPKENGGSVSVDLNENEDEPVAVEGKPGPRTLKERSLTLLTGVSGGQAAGWTRNPVDLNGKNAARDPEIMLVAPEDGYLSGPVVLGGVNGFSLEAEERREAGGPAVSSPAALQEEGDSSHPQDQRSCPGKPNWTSASVNMSNGVADSPEAAVRCLGQRLGQCELGCEEVKVANGGLHMMSPGSEWPGSDYFPVNRHSDPGFRRNRSPSWGDPRSGPLSTPEPSPGPASPCPSSPLSEPNTRQEDEEPLGDPDVPARPQSLRTNPAASVSRSCDATPLSPDEDRGFNFDPEAGRRQSAPDKLSEETGGSELTVMPKRFGIADFFTRSLFSRKPKESKAASHNATGWRLFSKSESREEDQSGEAAMTPQQEDEDSPCPQRPPAAGRRKNLEFEPLSTTALILEDRPSNLPAKSLEETQRHKLEYEEMVAGAKRREMKDAQKKKRQMKERHRQEDSISNAMVVWNTEILPHWDAMKGTRRVRDLWWQGLPPGVRGRVWSLAIGNELNITAELYEIFLSRAKEKWRSYSETSSVNDNESDGGASLADRESSLDLIKLDISRTFPSLFIFQKGGPYHDLLHSVLGAYTCYRPDIGYVQGMSFIAAVLILNLEEAEAFITFANLLNKPCQMAFFRVDHELMLKYFAAFEIFFEENLPRLFSHFQTNSLTPDLYLIDWIFTLYSKSLPLDVACRVWDVFCRDGEESLFRTGLGILRLFEDVLLQMDFIHIAQFLTRLPDDLQPHTLFTAMANTHMISRNRRWAQVFSAVMKDGNVREAEKSGSPALRS
ncbi:TBC1 domain family member 12-like isoform X2 [Poecilia latipinna]|uniref:TBC1 domain family member 12-like isoform X2 n=1 Tax=Poecilia latipinna TaxID=48699 RepID=UPI00072EC990|nr:PREDICTED: TBC1 domain family member 12-like isoform X2 [Poecilia latipinna]